MGDPLFWVGPEGGDHLVRSPYGFKNGASSHKVLRYFQLVQGRVFYRVIRGPPVMIRINGVYKMR